MRNNYIIVIDAFLEWNKVKLIILKGWKLANISSAKIIVTVKCIANFISWNKKFPPEHCV